MSERYEFFYDESEHSRKINQKTITADNYYENFVTGIVGWKESDSEKQQQKYLEFEEKYEFRKSKGELKSSTIKNTQLEYGFASLNSKNTEFLQDYFKLFDNSSLIYISAISKIEYIINQLFRDFSGNPFVSVESMRYIIVKAIVLYKPQKVIDGMYQNTKELVVILKDFFSERIVNNMSNPELKGQETLAFKQVIDLLDKLSHQFKIDWEYRIAFTGFSEYLKEKTIPKSVLYIDQEGRDSLTAKAAKEVGFKEVVEIDSSQSYGVRWADMLVGIITKLLKAIHNDLEYKSAEDGVNKKLLSEQWFNLTKEQLALYKQLDFIISELNNGWYKVYTGVYSDDLLTMLTLLNFMTQFSTRSELEYSNKKVPMPEQFNSAIVSRLAGNFDRMKSKLPLKSVPKKDLEQGFIFGKYGQKIYIDEERQPKLNMKEGGQFFEVLSVGLGKSLTPSLTILEDNKAVCYRIPNQLADWANYCIGLASMNQNPFPAKVLLIKQGEEYCANFL